MFAFSTLYFDFPPIKNRAVDVWLPKDGARQPVSLFFVHGGGWRNGHRDQMHALMAAFLQEGYVCISVDYRLNPSATIAEQVADIREGMALADAYLRKRDIHQPLVIYGSSAGGHLALLAALSPQGACGDTFSGNTPSVAGLIVSCAPITFIPWPDIFPPIWSSMQQAAGVSYENNPETYRRISPETYLSKGSPPILFLLAECEHMFPNALTTALVKHQQEQGGNVNYKVYPLAEHGFFYAIERRSQQMAFADTLAFLKKIATNNTPCIHEGKP